MKNWKDIKPGELFKFDNVVWKCTKNDGFMFEAENTNPDSKRRSFMWIGIPDEEVEIMSAE